LNLIHELASSYRVEIKQNLVVLTPSLVFLIAHIHHDIAPEDDIDFDGQIYKKITLRSYKTSDKVNSVRENN